MAKTLICTLLVQNVALKVRWGESSWVGPRASCRISAHVSSEIFHGDRKIGFLQSQDWIFAIYRVYSLTSPNMQWWWWHCMGKVWSPLRLVKIIDIPEKGYGWVKRVQHYKICQDCTFDTLGWGGWEALHGTSSFTITITDSARSFKGELRSCSRFHNL